MVVGNHEAGAGSISFILLPESLRQTADRVVEMLKIEFPLQLSPMGGRMQARNNALR